MTSGDQDFNFFGIPIPLTDEMITHMDREQMKKESLLHDIERLFVELDRDQLNTIRALFHYMSEDPSTRLASYYEGIAAQTLVLKHGVCGGCGQNHDEVLPPINEVPLVQEELNTAMRENTLTSEDRLNMAEYNLDDLRDIDTHELLGFICRNCGLKYRSIEDRMLRAKDACHGCFLKSAHG